MTMSHINAIFEYVMDSFIHIWPYLLITIPIAVAVKMSGATNYINRALTARPMIAILLATAVGAFSPLCSCSVVPVIAALLIGGVPLAPVMSFWLASPSMDPEIFFLTVSSLGWNLAVWRLVATLGLSLGGGFITHFMVQRGWLGDNFLRPYQSTETRTLSEVFQSGIRSIGDQVSTLARRKQPIPVEASACCESVNSSAMAVTDYSGGSELLSLPTVEPESTCGETCSVELVYTPLWRRLASETWDATTMVIKFMLLAWTIGAIVKLYVPQEWITRILSTDNPYSILTAAILGIPFYTSNLAAMPLVGGLLKLGMYPGAALSFLIAGPVTTLPAMSAVWGLVNRKVFSLYIGFSFIGAVVLGYLYGMILQF